MENATPRTPRSRKSTKQTTVGTMITVDEAAEEVSVHRSTLLRWAKQGLAPQPVVLGPQRIGFVRAEIVAWLRERIDGRDATKPYGGRQMLNVLTRQRNKAARATKG